MMQTRFENLKYGAGLAASIVALGVAGCGNSDPNNKPVSQAPAATGEATPDPTSPYNLTGLQGRHLAKHIAQLSLSVKGKTTVPKEFCVFTDDNPQPQYSKKPARFIVNTLCQPPLGEPASIYSSAKFSSAKTGKVYDGDIVKGVCIESNGQKTTNVTGPGSASRTWVKISEGKQKGFISEVNLSYIKDSNLKEC